MQTRARARTRAHSPACTIQDNLATCGLIHIGVLGLAAALFLLLLACLLRRWAKKRAVHRAAWRKKRREEKRLKAERCAAACPPLDTRRLESSRSTAPRAMARMLGGTSCVLPRRKAAEAAEKARLAAIRKAEREHDELLAKLPPG